MKPTMKLLLVSVAATTLVVFSPLAAAHSGGKANIGYVGDMNGHIALDGMGKCLRTSDWTPALALPECEPGMAPKPVAAAPKPAPAPSPAPAPVPVVEKITLKAGALFDTGKADLKQAGKSELDDLADKLKTVKGIESIQVTGHTDSQGRAESNQALSERRAEAVKSYLVSKGVNGSIISTRGMGASVPVADNATAAGRAQNRRVELEIKASQ